MQSQRCSTGQQFFWSRLRTAWLPHVFTAAENTCAGQQGCWRCKAESAPRDVRCRTLHLLLERRGGISAPFKMRPPRRAYGMVGSAQRVPRIRIRTPQKAAHFERRYSFTVLDRQFQWRTVCNVRFSRSCLPIIWKQEIRWSWMVSNGDFSKMIRYLIWNILNPGKLAGSLRIRRFKCIFDDVMSNRGHILGIKRFRLLESMLLWGVGNNFVWSATEDYISQNCYVYGKQLWRKSP